MPGRASPRRGVRGTRALLPRVREGGRECPVREPLASLTEKRGLPTLVAPASTAALITAPVRRTCRITGRRRSGGRGRRCAGRTALPIVTRLTETPCWCRCRGRRPCRRYAPARSPAASSPMCRPRPAWPWSDRGVRRSQPSGVVVNQSESWSRDGHRPGLGGGGGRGRDKSDDGESERSRTKTASRYGRAGTAHSGPPLAMSVHLCGSNPHRHYASARPIVTEPAGRAPRRTGLLSQASASCGTRNAQASGLARARRRRRRAPRRRRPSSRVPRRPSNGWQ